MAVLLRHAARLTSAILALSLCAASSRADEITIDGKRYEDVLVRESPSRYYVWIPSESRTISIPKDKAQDVALTQDPAARGKLIQGWMESQQRQKANTPVKSEREPEDPAERQTSAETAATERNANQASTDSGTRGNTNAPPLQEIVAAYAEHQDRLLNFIDTFRLEEIRDDPRDPVYGKWIMFFEGRYACDDTHFLYDRLWWYEPPVPTATKENPSSYRLLWDGANQWSYGGRVKPIPEGPRVSLRVIPDARACPRFGPAIFQNPRHDRPFPDYDGKYPLGYLVAHCESDARRIDEILTDTPSARVHPNTERVEDVECYVVDVDLREGALTVWFDPARQYNIPKAVWRYRPGSGVENPEWRIRKYEEVYRVRDYMQAQDLWIPKETTREWYAEYENGKKDVWRYRFRRLTFEVNPDFEARKTFTLLDTVEDGTEVSQSVCAGVNPNTGEHLDLFVRKYVWDKGKLTPAEDPPIPEWAEVPNVPVLTETP